MSFTAKTILKPISMATNGCFVSVPSLFTPSKASLSRPSSLAIQFKPITFQKEILLSLKRKEPFLRISVIAAQQREGSPLVLEEQEQEFEGNLDLDVSENGAEGEEESETGFVEPPEEAKVYVGNLPYDVDSEKLAQLFEQAGVVEISEVIYDRVNDRSRGFGFVTMSTVEEAEKAVDMFHRYDLNGRLLTVNKAAPRGSRPERPPQTFEPTNRIYVGNLPWNVDDSTLEELFSEHGKVISARVVTDRETGRSRGFGFVVMANESEMNDAIGNLDGQNLEGRAIRVNVAEERPRRGGF